MEILLSAFIGGAIGLVLAVFFQEPLQKIKAKLLKQFGAQRHLLMYTGESKPGIFFRLGGLQTSWYVIDGNGEMTYTPNTIHCIINATHLELPSLIKQRRAEIEQKEKENKRKGLPYRWNGPFYALERHVPIRTVPSEHLELLLTFRPSDYYTFLATVMSLDTTLPSGTTIRRKYLNGKEYLTTPIPFLAQGFGVSLVGLTKDRKMILTRRSDNAGARPGELDVSVVEAVHPEKDVSATKAGPDIYKTAIRGAREEIGIEIGYNDVHFFGYGVDQEYYQWNMIGMFHISVTAKEALEIRNRGSEGKWEVKDFQVIDAHPRRVFEHIKERKLWSTALISIYWTLVHEFGSKNVDREVEKVFGT